MSSTAFEPRKPGVALATPPSLDHEDALPSPIAPTVGYYVEVITYHSTSLERSLGLVHALGDRRVRRGRRPDPDPRLRGWSRTRGAGRLSTRLAYVREEGLRAGAHVLKNLRAKRGDPRGKLWELRLENSPNNPRILTFATEGRTLVLLHGFRKTGRPDDKIPEREVRIALRRMRRYLERRGTP
jgi:phage-related protein